MDDTGDQLNVLILTQLFAPTIGGAAAVPEALASNLPNRLSIVAARDRNSLPRSESWLSYDRQFSFPVHRVEQFETKLSPRLPPKLRGPLQFAYNAMINRPSVLIKLFRLLSSHPVEAVCVNTMMSCYWVPEPLKLRYPQLRVVFFLHGEEVNDRPQLNKLDRLAHASLRKADAVIVVSSFTRERALRCGVQAERITVIHNGVDVRRFTPGPRNPKIEARFGLEGKKVLLCLARLDERKGQDRLIEAMLKILVAVPETILLIVGGGSDEPRLKALVEQLALQDHVRFAGVAADEDLVLYYRTADVFAMPNRTLASGDTEGFGLVFLEAGACSKPVIGGRAGGVPDAIVDGETGFLVDGNSASGIAAACIQLLQDPGLAARLGANGLAHSAGLSWEEQARRFLQVCERAGSAN
jgi:phosphatidylinositol alpha-1,6-mannosyltransferase